MKRTITRLVVGCCLCGTATWAACASDDAGQKPDPASAAAAPPASPPPADPAFAALADKTYQAYLETHPGLGVELGLHAYDGRVPDVSAGAIQRETAQLHELEAEVAAVDAQRLSTIQRVEREVLLSVLRNALFRIEVLRYPQRNPIVYSLSLSEYISRPYAPLADRAQAVIQVANASPTFFAQAQENLDEVMPRTFVNIALLQTKGTVTFVRDDVKLAFADLQDPKLAAKLAAALDTMASTLEQHATFLEQRLAKADDNYALGTETFLGLLKVQNTLDIDLPTLKAVAERDLARNTKAIEAAARQIDKDRPVADVVAEVLANKPAADAVLDEARAQMTELRAHIKDNNIVTIPSDDVAEVKVTPPFLRYNFAFLDGAGPFESTPLPSFYYITPPDPSWPPEKQAAYVPGKTDLLGTSIHEVWPGHFLHMLHKKQVPSKILKSFWNYAMGEGWAHYVEEMMVTTGGYHADDPATQIGMLINALLRNVRFLSAIGLHCEGMTVAASEAMFKARAFQDDGNAQQQAVRGTFDPMYLSYTLGKLMIMKLKEDVRAEQGDAFSAQAFHDRFLSYGAAPVPVIRRAMLGDDAGPAL